MTIPDSVAGAERSPTPVRWGAQPSDWSHFDLVLGLGADLLPVVSNPDAVIAESSSLKSKGKTPSVYRRDRTVVGLNAWTSMTASDQDLARWSREPDYGICVQTRRVRAIDIDVTDAAEADAVEQMLMERLGLGPLPARVRGRSPRRLLVVDIAEPCVKRSFKTAHGLVEFLADGQQFVAVGAHPSGDRYAWRDGLPLEIPSASLAQMDAAWAALCDQFAIEAPRAARTGAGGAGHTGGGLEDDEIAQWLEANWETFGVRDRKLFVRCPWRDGHSGDSGPTEASWMLAGTGGYAQGHFNCMHASCQGRTDDAFLDATGYRMSLFAVEAGSDTPVFEDAAWKREALARADRLGGGGGSGGAAKTEQYSWPPLRQILCAETPALGRDKKGILATQTNHIAAIDAPGFFGWFIGRDAFLDEVMVCRLESFGMWERLSDNHYTEFRARLERLGFQSASKEMVRDAVALVAERHVFDSAQRWLESLEWDGVPRVRAFCQKALGSEDSLYTESVGFYLWTALAGRVMAPGCQADMALILTGEQGKRKTSVIKAIAPMPEHFTHMNFSKIDDKDTQLLIRGKLIGEFGELKGLRGKAREEVKEYITKQVEEWVPKFKSCTVRYQRRLLLAGTTNEVEFLDDPTGNRRWLPVRAGDCDVDWTTANRDQLWAEGLALWRKAGIAWQDAERLAAGVHAEFRSSDVWEESVVRWLEREDLSGERPADREALSSLEVIEGALNTEARSFRKTDYIRLADVMTSLGYARSRGGWSKK